MKNITTNRIKYLLGIIIVGITLICCSGGGTAYASEKQEILSPFQYNGVYQLYLPYGYDRSNLIFRVPDNITTASDGILNQANHTVSGDFSNVSTVTLTSSSGYSKYVSIKQSTIPSVQIQLNGTTLSTINAGSKDTKYPDNTLKIASPNDSENIAETTGVQVKGRGNSTWHQYKKPYQIKFSKKTSLFGIKKAKKWVLLADATDPSLLRNETAQNLAKAMGLKSSRGKMVDLFVDGDYIGNYYLCQQVDDNLAGLKNDEGILAEMDNIWYASEAVNYYSKACNSHFTIKATKADDELDDNGHYNPNSTGAKAFNNFKNAVESFNNDLYTDNKNWNKISSHIDIDSFAKFYLLQEFVANWDGVNSSMYVYQDGPNDKLHMGPAWDFDLTLGNNTRASVNRAWLNTGVRTSIDATWFSELMKIPEFQRRVKIIYQEQMVPAIESQKKYVTEESKKITQSADMNHKRYNLYGHSNIAGPSLRFASNYNACVQSLSNWLTNRKNYFDKYFSESHISYEAHVQNIGWQGTKLDGAIAGTSGQSLRLEAIRINLNNAQYSGNIEYRTHIQNLGWQKQYATDGKLSGTSGKSLRLEAIQIRLTGEMANHYDIYYRVHAQHFGWMGWAKNGQKAGTSGYGYRLEAIQIKLVLKGGIAPKNDGMTRTKSVFAAPKVNYTTHVQKVGWQPYVKDGATAGTSGRSLRLEGIRIKVNNELASGSVRYRTHIQRIGWQGWRANNQLSGTSGKSLRLEAIQIQLTGQMAQKYDVYYRVHAQHFGWMGWAKNGGQAGTAGYAYRLEAIQIKLVPKGGKAPGTTKNAFRRR